MCHEYGTCHLAPDGAVVDPVLPDRTEVGVPYG